MRLVLPQIMPRLITCVRLALGPAWLFLIAAEAIASTEGLGYRIFLVRRYLSMDVILPYVAWITLLAVITDWLLVRLSAGDLPLGASGGGQMSRIVVHGLEKSYGDARVLERVNVTAEAGEFLSLVGASGCGKSTFLRILLGQEQQSSGVVIVGDGPIVPEPTPQRGIVFQRYSVFPHLTAMQNLLLVEDFRSGGPFGRVFGARRRNGQARGRGHAGAGRPRPCARPLSGIALRRHAAAAGDRADLARPSADPASRRAVRRARSRHPRRDARTARPKSGPSTA